MIPDTLHASLKCACRAAILDGNDRSRMNLEKWSQTYGNCGTEHVRAMWDHELSKLSREPRNSYEEPAE